MSFHNINSFQYSNIDNNGFNLNFKSISLNKFELKNNVQYKLNVIKQKSIESFTEYSLSLNENLIKTTTSKHPEKALTISLQQGIYKIKLAGLFGIYNKETNKFNDCIKSSKGDIKITDCEFINSENKFDEDGNLNYSNIKYKSIDEFQFKMNRSGQFSIWIESSNKNDIIGNFNFYLIKISNSKFDENIESYLFTNETYNSLIINLIPQYLYSFEIYKLENDEIIFTPKYKYPEGNYQITLNSTLITSSNDELINSIKNNDKKNFDISFGRIKNLHNISIPYNVNPLNYYYMIGKIEFLMYFDFISDTYYFQPISFAECFMALYVPRSTCKLIEQNENDTYSIFKITSYVIIHHDFRNEAKIRENIRKWLNVTDDKIHIDNYKLYYWIDLQDCDSSLYYNIVNKLQPINSYYSYINLEITGIIYDDVSLPITEDEKLNYSISNAVFTVLNEECSTYNHISWEQIGDWKNYQNVQNSLYSNISGNGIIKITKQHFKNATGIDLETQQTGTLTKEQLINLNINEPELPIYNRFQYWLRTSKF